MKPTPTPPRKRTGPPNVDPTQDTVGKIFSILPSDLKALESIGNGNRSAGLRTVLNFYRRHHPTTPTP